MKSLISVVIVLVVGSAFAQTNTNATPPTTPAATTPAPTPTPVPKKAKVKAAVKKAVAAPAAETPAPVAAPAAPAAPAAAEAPAATVPVTTDAAATTTPSDVTMDEEAPAVSADLSLPQGVMTNLGLTYFSRDLNETVNSNIGTDADVSLFTSELKVGYIFDFGLFAGATMHYDMGKASGQSITTQYAGPTIGYSCSYTGFLAMATYHLIGTADFDTAGKYDQVNGLQIDISYPMSITEKLKFGPQLTWRDMEQTEGDNALPDDKTKELVPFMGVWYIF
jgi:hypothetical protein